MKKFSSLFIFILCISVFAGNASAIISVTVTNRTNTTPNLGATYITFSAAILALNNVISMTGPVILTLTGGQSETAPPTGFVLGSASLNAAVSSLKTITIIKGTGNAVTLNAGTGGTGTPGTATQNAILKLNGADWITINGLTFVDGNAANPATMESGIAFMKLSATDGCQNNTIINCTITLNRINNAAAGSVSNMAGSVGIQGYNSLNASASTNLTVTSVNGANSNNNFYNNTIQNCNIGIGLSGFASATLGDIGNDIGGTSDSTGNIIKNFGGAVSAANPAAGVRLTEAIGGTNISFNTINSNDGAGVNHISSLRGIFALSGINASATISNNTITLKGGTNSTIDAILNGIGSGGAGNTVDIINNSITGCTFTNPGFGAFTGISNSANAANVNINNNSLTNNSTVETNGVTNMINNIAMVTSSLNINDNTINGWTYSSATTSTFNCINNSAGTTTAAVSISRNNIQSINHTVNGTGPHIYIRNDNPTSNIANINNNKFINLNIKTSGAVTFIKHLGNMTTGTDRCDSNSIITFFSKIEGAPLSFFESISNSGPGSTMINNNNNFSNVSIQGVSNISGWNNSEGSAGSGPSKIISNNTFRSIFASLGTVAIINAANSGSCTISNNVISSAVGSQSIKGIILGNSNSGPLSISNNQISGLDNSFTGTTTAIETSAPVIDIYRNKIYALYVDQLSGIVSGIHISGGQTVRIFNNIIGSLFAPLANSSSEVIRGINITSTTPNSSIDLFYNTVHLFGNFNGGNFSSTAVYQTASPVSTTAKLTMRNNILINKCIPAGNGITVVFRRSGSNMSNYSSASNNNLFYAGTAGPANVVYYDGAYTDQHLFSLKSRIAPAESFSFEENASFINANGQDSNYLHLNPLIPTSCESGAVNIPGFNLDYDGVIRQGNPGYTGASTTGPDVGADEGNFVIANNQTLTLNLRLEQIQLSRRDTITVSLRSAVSPYPVIDTKKILADTSGITQVPFTNAVNGDQYYIFVSHRNSISTWSESPVLCISNSMSFDFTEGVYNAYGNNQVLVNGIASIYSGDVCTAAADSIPNGSVDLQDVLKIFNDNSNFVSGPYNITDLNYDGVTNTIDVLAVYNNSGNFVHQEDPL